MSSDSRIWSVFQSTLSVRRATTVHKTAYGWSPISIHALRKESDVSALGQTIMLEISIHALRKESDISSVAR